MPITSGSGGSSTILRYGAPFLLGAVLFLAGCAAQQAASGPFPRFAEFEGEEVRRVTFTGDLSFSTDSLRAVVRTRASRCRFLFIPVCVPFTNIGKEEYRLDLTELARDVVRIQLYHRDHGYYGAQVMPRVERLRPDQVAVEFAIYPGRQVYLRDLNIVGVDSVLPPEEVAAAIPLEEGEPFGRLNFLASADTIRNRLLARGHAYADVLRNYGLDTIAGFAEAEFVAIPGPVVYVDTILVEGNERLTERTLRRQLTFGEGGILRVVDLDQSQRNLYNLDMVSFAAVRLAPDTLQMQAEQEQATVIVQVSEAAQFPVEASLGFGTVDCLRASGRWVNRNFLGGGRRLEVNGSISRVGVGAPFDFGLDRPCTPLDEEDFFGLPGRIEDHIDYSLVTEFRQPNILGTQNQLAVNFHSERISEVGAYVRESFGGRVAAVRELNRGPTVLTTTLLAERGRTFAGPAFLCVGFDTCTEDDLSVLTQYRWSNSVSVAAAHDAETSDGVTSRGYIVRGGLDWASSIFLSDDSYLRALVEGAYYFPLQPGWVLATNLRYGRFLGNLVRSEGGDRGYIPPERRFYAGGPSSVRGFTRNALGPTTYVKTGTGRDASIVGSATGGTELFVSSAELRMPSPWMGDILRTAAFVDAGYVASPFSATGIRFTPGVGLRFITPVGPFRFDIAYNPYNRETGPLYILDGDGLILDDPNFEPERPSFFGRFRIQFALGQAF